MSISAATGAETSNFEQDIQRTAQIAANACVSIESSDGTLGSGVFMPDGSIVTAAHVTSVVGSIAEVHTIENGILQARVIYVDHEMDAAVLELLNAPQGMPMAPELSEEEEPGQIIEFVAAGHAGINDEQARIRFGRGFQQPDGEHFISNCRIVPGDSGGPLFNLEGALVGIHLTVDQSGDQFSTHLPITEILDRWPSLAES